MKDREGYNRLDLPKPTIEVTDIPVFLPDHCEFSSVAIPESTTQFLVENWVVHQNPPNPPVSMNENTVAGSAGRITCVPREPMLFWVMVAQNVAHGRSDVAREEPNGQRGSPRLRRLCTKPCPIRLLLQLGILQKSAPHLDHSQRSSSVSHASDFGMWNYYYPWQRVRSKERS